MADALSRRPGNAPSQEQSQIGLLSEELQNKNYVSGITHLKSLQPSGHDLVRSDYMQDQVFKRIYPNIEKPYHKRKGLLSREENFACLKEPSEKVSCTTTTM